MSTHIQGGANNQCEGTWAQADQGKWEVLRSQES